MRVGVGLTTSVTEFSPTSTTHMIAAVDLLCNYFAVRTTNKTVLCDKRIGSLVGLAILLFPLLILSTGQSVVVAIASALCTGFEAAQRTNEMREVVAHLSETGAIRPCATKKCRAESRTLQIKIEKPDAQHTTE